MNLHRTTTDDLEGLFDKYGRIGDVYIPKDYRTKESRGFGFVRYFNKWVSLILLKSNYSKQIY